MAYHYDFFSEKDLMYCMRCGRRIRLLDHGNAGMVAQVSGTEHKGFQCIVCGQITCFDCSDNRLRCRCGGNSWFARIYRHSVLSEIAAD